LDFLTEKSKLAAPASGGCGIFIKFSKTNNQGDACAPAVYFNGISEDKEPHRRGRNIT